MGAAAKNSNAKETTITGVEVAKIQRDPLIKVLLGLGLEVAADDTNKALAVRLGMHYTDTIKDKDLLAECDNCGGVSDASLDACPYCGAADGASEAATASTPPPAAPAPAPAAPAAATTSEPARPATKEDTTMGSAAAKDTKKGKGKATAAAAPTAAVVPAAKGHLQSVATEKDLNKAVAEVQRMKGDAAVSMHALGGKINDIYSNRLWTLRQDEGKAKYKGFDAFCHEELGMTPQNAYALMDVAKHFTAEDVRKFGTTKLGLLLQAPKEEQERIKKDLVERGASKREVEAEVRKVKKEKGHRRADRDGKTRPSSGTGKSAKVRRENITVAKILGRTTIKLYQAKLDKDGKKVLATKISQLPYGELELENGVVEMFRVQEAPDGTLRLVVERKRQTED